MEKNAKLTSSSFLIMLKFSLVERASESLKKVLLSRYSFHNIHFLLNYIWIRKASLINYSWRSVTFIILLKCVDDFDKPMFIFPCMHYFENYEYWNWMKTFEFCLNYTKMFSNSIYRKLVVFKNFIGIQRSRWNFYFAPEWHYWLNLVNSQNGPYAKRLQRF